MFTDTATATDTHTWEISRRSYFLTIILHYLSQFEHVKDGKENTNAHHLPTAFVPLAQILPTEENFLLLFRFDNPLDSSVEFMKPISTGPNGSDSNTKYVFSACGLYSKAIGRNVKKTYQEFVQSSSSLSSDRLFWLLDWFDFQQIRIHEAFLRKSKQIGVSGADFCAECEYLEDDVCDKEIGLISMLINDANTVPPMVPFGIGGRDVSTGLRTPSTSFHPDSVGEGMTGLGLQASIHTRL
ncbi:Calbindin-32 [Nymphon striatum]|nr:Calbindin-32 [Nymphon striatum]